MSLRRTGSGRSPAVRSGGVVSVDEPDALVVQWTREITERVRELGRRDVEGRVAVGRLFADVKRRLGHGAFGAWVERDVPVDVRTVQRHMSLAKWADEDPATYQAYRHLGATKLYLIARQPADVRKRLFGRKIHRVPERGTSGTLEQLANVDFFKLVMSFRKRGAVPTPAEVARKRFQQAVRALDDRADDLVEHAAAIDLDTVKKWRAAILRTAKQLAKVFEMSD